MPAKLTFDTQEDVETVFGLISQFREAALKGKYSRVVLAQDDIEELAPEVAIMFLAELQRCAAYCSRRKVLSGTYPRSPLVAELLTKLGFYDALNVAPPQLPGSYDHRTFVSVVSGHKSEAQVIDKLLSCFDSVLRLSLQDKRNLHVAILECMDNVYEHAYVKDDYLPYLYREWWLVGFADQITNTVSFIFFDQGYGIVRTIKTFKRRLLHRRMPLWSDSAWIRRAVTKQISRHRSLRRGHGLPRLKRFIDDAEVDGVMRVMANHGEYTQLSKRPSATREFKAESPGTMIVWSLSVPADVQLRLDL